MKKVLFAALLSGGLLSAGASDAQVQVGLQINIGVQPQWGPVGYTHVEYYYMPDIDCYYYVPRQQFVYMDGGQWRFAASLPARYGSYDMYRGYKVVVNEPRPYLRGDYYREQYRQYRGAYGQQVAIRDHHHVEGQDDEYDHPGRNGRGHAYGHDKHRDHDHGDDNR